MKIVLNTLLLLTITLFTLPGTAAQHNWYLKPYVGLSELSDTSGNASDIEQLSGPVEVSLDAGFTAGLSLGYQYTDNLAFEFGWEYRSNDSTTTIDDQLTFNEGNYASSMFMLNAMYNFQSDGKFTPYLGAGLTWAQEVDIDLEQNGEELSYSGSGDTGYQLFAGVEYRFTPKWTANLELRYSAMSDIDLDGEGSVGQISGLDYKSSGIQFGVRYDF